MEGQWTVIVASVLVVSLFLHLWQRYARLSHIPGPFWSQFTDIPRAIWVGGDRAHETHDRLHRRYGDLVRLGPNMISISNPSAIPTIYPARSGFRKGDFYHAFTNLVGQPTSFEVQDEVLHQSLRAPIASFYFPAKLEFLESVIDLNLNRLCEQLDRRAATSSEPVTLLRWLNIIAFENMWSWTFTESYGLIAKEGCGDDMLATNVFVSKTLGVASQSTLFRRAHWAVLMLLSFLKSGISPLVKAITDLVHERHQELELEGKIESKLSNRKDMVARVLHLRSHKSDLSPGLPASAALTNIFAGTDSTTVALGTIWYNLLRYPDTIHRLHNELLAAKAQGKISLPWPAYKEIHNLPYLDACVKEALRIQPPFCLPLERVVPTPGVTVCGSYLPPGTIVGVNPYVSGRHEPTFGADSALWRPERWLECSIPDRRRLDQCLFTFGSGRRVCLGKHAALMEIKKLVSALLLRYKMDLINPDAFKIRGSWLARPEGLDVTIRRRQLV